MNESEEDVPQLSAETFAALQEFYKEQSEKQRRLQTGLCNPVKIEEDWQLSQFWYDENTINTIVEAVLKSLSGNNYCKIALISCPTLYTKLKEKSNSSYEVTLFEYDQRFSIYGSDFVLYDYKSPLDVPQNHSNYYDIVIADPPFLSEECLSKTAVTIKFLAKQKVVLCTGAIMEDLASRLLDVKKCKFVPGHVNNLANEFSCYTNFDFDKLIEIRL